MTSFQTLGGSTRCCETLASSPNCSSLVVVVVVLAALPVLMYSG